MLQNEGVPWITDILFSSIRRVSARLSVRSSEPAITIVAPFANGTNNSNTDMSKERVTTANRISLSDIPGLTDMLFIRLTTDLCRTLTPFGLPVEPEVYIM